MGKFLISALALALSSSALGAEAATILSYTQTGVAPSGYGGWTYNYDAEAGTGTLNDGIIPTSNINDELLSTLDNNVITFKVAAGTNVFFIDILSDYTMNNVIPGNLISADVTIDGIRETVLESGYGPLAASGLPVNERLTLPTALSALPTDTITLSNFVANFGPLTALGEVSINGSAVSAAPEPGEWLLMLVAIGGIGVALSSGRRRVLSD